MKHLLVGFVALFLGIWGIIAWWSLFGLVLRGVMPFGLVLFGLIALMAGLRKVSTEVQGKRTTIRTASGHE